MNRTVQFVAAAAHAWMNEHGHGTYWTTGPKCNTRRLATKEGP